jgi:hypothetical protein
VHGNRHEPSDRLRNTVERHVDESAEAGSYDSVLLARGLCGSGLAGIQARTLSLMAPHAQDCCTLFLGSKKA